MVKLYQKYFGYEIDNDTSGGKFPVNSFHFPTLLNIPSNMFKNASKLKYFNSGVAGQFSMPLTVREIGDSALEGATSINSLVFSFDIENIGRIDGPANSTIRHFTFPKLFNTRADMNSNILTSLERFIERNCNIPSISYYIHVPYNFEESIRSSPYYQVIKESRADSNIKISFIRPRKFTFQN
jgi:hypothetical protein